MFDSEKKTGISRRTFMKGAAAGAAGLAVASTVLGSTAMAATAGEISVNKSACAVEVNGKSVDFEAYLINSNNYLKLRDLAYILNGTAKQFAVSFNSSSKAVNMTSKQAYTVVGGEMSSLPATATAKPTAWSVSLDGKIVDATAYLINGNNYFKLRDICEALDIYVGYDSATNGVSIDTAYGYGAVVSALAGSLSGINGSKGGTVVKKPASGKDGLYINDFAQGWINITDDEYTLPFIEVTAMKAIFDGEEKEGVIWRSSNKGYVCVNSRGEAKMAEGVGKCSSEVSAEWDGTVYSATLLTTPKSPNHSVTIDDPLTRGEFMVTIANIFNWFHYNNFMDDGVDVDTKGNPLAAPKVRNYYDVNGDAEFVKAIECALDAEVLSAKSSKEKFYPYADMTREDAAQIIVDAFGLSAKDSKDYISAFDDADDISAARYQALNILVGQNYFHGRTDNTLSPKAGITEPELRIILQQIKNRVVMPVWTMPKSGRRLARARMAFFCPTDNVEIYFRWRTYDMKLNGVAHSDETGVADINTGNKPFCPTNTYGTWRGFIHGQYKNLAAAEAGDASQLTNKWGYTTAARAGTGTVYASVPADGTSAEEIKATWGRYIPGYNEDCEFGVHNQSYEPAQNLQICFEFQYCAFDREGKLEPSPIKTTYLTFARLPWNEPVTDTIHEKQPGYPKVVRFFDNFQACAYYIEGSERGILYDGLTFYSGATYGDKANLKEILVEKNLVGKDSQGKLLPYSFFLGHNHVDHKGAMGDFNAAGLECAVCDRVGPLADYECAKAYEEGDIVDLGDVQLEVYHLPGHEDGSLILYDRANSLIFSSDIYGVNRYWVGDNFGATGVKQDLLLSLQQQLMTQYLKDGGQVKEVYTGHNRVGSSFDYLKVWEQGLQNLVNFGPNGYYHNHRGNGSIVALNATDNDRHMNNNWQAFSESGTQYMQEYTGAKDGKSFYRVELDPATIRNNTYYAYDECAALSNIVFKDATLVGVDFLYKAGQSSMETKLDDGRYKYAIPNKFFPLTTEYQVKIKAGQSKVTVTPTAMSDMIASLTVNGSAAASRCPVTVSTSTPLVIKLVAPNGETSMTYTFTFVNA